MKFKTWAAFLTVCTIWGASYLFIKVAGQDLTPFTLVSWRLGLASAGLWSILLLTKTSPPCDLPTLARLFVLGMLNMTIPFALITWGERTIDSSMASVLNATTPLFSLIIAHFALAEERITWQRLAGLVVGFSGVVVIFSENLGAALLHGGNWPMLRGQLAVVLASLSYAGAAVFVRRQLRHVPAILLAAVPISMAFLTTLLLAFLFETPVLQSLAIGSSALIAIICLGLLGTCLAHILYFYVMQTWGATRATMVTYLIPALGVVLGAVILDEPIGWRLFVGLVLIVGGIVVVTRKPRPTEEAGPDLGAQTS
jgi:drug/metabolite transporter (DMT)-like permease